MIAITSSILYCFVVFLPPKRKEREGGYLKVKALVLK